MSTTIWHTTMSLDGFIAGPDHAMEWAFEYGGSSAIVDEIMSTTGAIVAGRNWYDIATDRYDGRQGIYGGAWDGPVFVLTHRPPAEPEDPGITFLTGDVHAALARARAAAGGKNVEVFGADTARQFLSAGLLDEIVIHLAPLLLGDGVRLHGGPGSQSVPLTRTYAAEAGDLVDLRFRVAK
jgi:dihydrofolate reductase